MTGIDPVANTGDVTFRSGLSDAEYALRLGLSDKDVDHITSLIGSGIRVSRSVMHGEGYVSVSWSFSPDWDDEAEQDESSE